MTARVASAALWVQFTEEFRARVHALSRSTASQFSTFFRGATCFAHWDVDAVHGAALARLQTDEIRGPSGRFRLRKSNSYFVAGFDRRIFRGPLQPASQRDRHADGGDDPGVSAGAVGALAADSCR